ncbi:MAG: hypothetical protein IT463_02840 [Planctomycetes bacterium]|nr:hypothetical protein [Planctomycetota bacterium]
MRALLALLAVFASSLAAEQIKTTVTGITTTSERCGSLSFSQPLGDVELVALPMVEVTDSTGTTDVLPANVTGSARSDTQGRFSLVLTLDPTAGTRLADAMAKGDSARLLVLARTAEHCGLFAIAALAGASQAQVLEVSASSATGRALDSNKRPLANCDVTLWLESQAGGMCVSQLTAKTDANGEYKIQVPSGHEFDLRVSGNISRREYGGRQYSGYYMAAHNHQDNLGTMAFLPTGTVSGKLPDLKPDRFGKALGTLRTADDVTGRYYRQDFNRECHLVVAAGKWLLAIEGEAYSQFEFELEAGKTIDLATLKIPVPRTLKLVIKAPAGARLGSMTATIESQSANAYVQAQQNENGEWEFTPVPTGYRDWKLSMRYMEGVLPVENVDVTIPDDATSISVNLRSPARLLVHVDCRSGTYYPNLYIVPAGSEVAAAYRKEGRDALTRAGAWDSDSREQVRWLRADETGALEPGRYVVVALFDDPESAADQEVDLVEGELTEITLKEFMPRMRLRMTSNGAPVANTTVQLRPLDEEAYAARAGEFGETDADGWMVWEPAGCGEFQIIPATDAGWEPAPAEEGQPGYQDWRSRRFSLSQPLPEEMTLDLTLTFYSKVNLHLEPDGGPAPTSVWLSQPQDWVAYREYFPIDAIQDLQDGCTGPQVLTPGRYRLLAYTQESSLGAPLYTHDIAIAPGTHGDLVVKPKSRAVTGSVVTDNGAIASLRIVWLHPEKTGALLGGPDVADDGTFRLDCPPLGDYLLEATANGVSRSVRLTGDKPIQGIRIDLRGQTGAVAVALRTVRNFDFHRVLVSFRGQDGAEFCASAESAVMWVENCGASLQDGIPVGTFDVILRGPYTEECVIPGVRVEAGKTALCETTLKDSRYMVRVLHEDEVAPSLYATLHEGTVELLDAKGSVIATQDFFSQSWLPVVQLEKYGGMARLEFQVRDPRGAAIRVSFAGAKPVVIAVSEERYEEDPETTAPQYPKLVLLPE